MKKTSIVAAVVAGIMTLGTGSYAFAAGASSASASVVKTNESDLMVMPDAGTDSVRLHFAGAERLHTDIHGGLTIFRGNAGLRYYRPDAYQVINGKMKSVEVRFRIEGRDKATIEFGKIDPGAPVILRWGAVMSTQSALM